jgi:hypothetical protein
MGWQDMRPIIVLLCAILIVGSLVGMVLAKM